METSCGTPEYAGWDLSLLFGLFYEAPEVLLGEEEYDKSVDLWAVGVITYIV